MDAKGFQEHCIMLSERLDNNIVNDGDLDTFSDIISNVMGREDFKAPGTAYAALSARVSDIYEKAMIQPMPPIIARLYQICRTFDNYRPRPLTELEIKAQKAEVVQVKKQNLLVEVKDGIKTIANCWWEDKGGTDEAAFLVADFVESLGDARDESAAVAGFAAVGGGFEILDEESQTAYPDIPTVKDRDAGIIGIGKEGIARNSKRKGHQIKVYFDKDTVYADNYMIEGIDYYRETHDVPAGFAVDKLPKLSGDLVEYPFVNARVAAESMEAMPEVFGLPGSSNQVVVKFPM